MRTWAVAGPASALIALAWLTTPACSRTPAEPPATEAAKQVARLQRATAMLERQVELAAGKEFYLVLDPAVPDLALMLRGAELRRYRVLGLTLGQPRVAWVSRGGDRPWRGVVWAGGELDPARQVERVVVQEKDPVPEGAEPAPPPVPPTAEERFPVPMRYHIRFADGLSVEIRPREADASTGRWARARAWWGAKWRDVLAVVRPQPRDALRLRVVLSPADAESLYRALPPDVRLLVLAGGSEPQGRARP